MTTYEQIQKNVPPAQQAKILATICDTLRMSPPASGHIENWSARMESGVKHAKQRADALLEYVDKLESLRRVA